MFERDLDAKRQEKAKALLEFEHAQAAKDAETKDAAQLNGSGEPRSTITSSISLRTQGGSKKEPGTINWVRRTLEQLNAILTERDLPASAAALPQGEKDKIQEAAQTIDRIILYVDNQAGRYCQILRGFRRTPGLLRFAVSGKWILAIRVLAEKPSRRPRNAPGRNRKAIALAGTRVMLGKVETGNQSNF